LDDRKATRLIKIPVSVVHRSSLPEQVEEGSQWGSELTQVFPSEPGLTWKMAITT